jgi:UDP-GlcNAc:undecaprenyl-phosphate/decaprenyl-phosphate GlcNAc-1-phosphate transferase
MRAFYVADKSAELLVTFMVSFFIQYLCITAFKKRKFCSDRLDSGKPQRLHNIATPRSGGLGIFIASSSALTAVSYEGLLVALLAFPAFAIGFYEDLRSNVGPQTRLLLLASSATVTVLTLHCPITDIRLFAFPPVLAVAFTVFAIVGVSNSINIVDGLNGLASGIAALAFTVFGVAAYFTNDMLVLIICLFMVASLLGFIIWNFPHGRIFLGDGGAYYIGYLLAVTSLLLVTRNHEISPWFPLVALIYPIYEVVFSIYRRESKRSGSAMFADRLHLHSLIYHRVTKGSRWTSMYLWLPAGLIAVSALIFSNDTLVLIFIAGIFVGAYTYTYNSIVRLRFTSKQIEWFNLAELPEALVQPVSPEEIRNRNPLC